MAEQTSTGYFQNQYKFNGKELDQETGLYYYGARYYDPKGSLWLSVDPFALIRVSLSPYNYCSYNPINRVDPDGRLDDWVGKKNKDGTTTWTWNAYITSQEQATADGYDTYSKPGKIINTTSGEKVRLGEEGAIHTGIIGIHSNVDPDAGLTDGHAWISTSTVDGSLMSTYSLWPDEHPLFQGHDPSGIISDVRTDTELNAGYASASGNYSYYRYITKTQSINLNGFIGTSDTWGYTHTCADWSRDAFKAATGIRLNVDDWFGLETPRKLSGTIIKLGANTPQTPVTNENRNGSSR